MTTVSRSSRPAPGRRLSPDSDPVFRVTGREELFEGEYFVIILTEDELVDPVMAAIHTAGRLDEHGTGMVFVVPVEQVAGIKEAIVRREPH